MRSSRRGGARWDRARRAAKERDGWRCRLCGRAGRLEVDHVLPLHKGGPEFDPANMQTLCRACHVNKTNVENGVKPWPAEWSSLVYELT